MKLFKGQRVIITFSSGGFEDTGKVGVFVSNYKEGRYYVYIEGSKNNVHNCKDKYGNAVTWNFRKGHFKVLESDGQLLFDFMYEE